jgi:hypothetical protein
MYRILTELIDPIDNELAYIHEVIRKSSFPAYEKHLKRYYPTFKILEKEETDTRDFEHDERAFMVTFFSLRS